MGTINKVYIPTDEEFIQLCEESSSISEINNKLGYSSIGTHTYLLIRERISNLDRKDLEEKFKAKQVRGEYKKKIANLSKEELQIIVKDSNTLSECLDKIGVKRTGNKNSFYGKVFTYLKQILNEYNIDYSHFSQTYGINNYVFSTKVNIDKYFIKNSTHGTTPMKRIILRENLIEYKCSCCGNNGYWNNKNLNLQLHHIDGDRTNNELSNLTFLCPNCHSQTENYSGSNANK